MAALQRTDVAAEIPSGEIFGPICDYPGLPCGNISYGLPFDKAIVKHVSPDAKVYVIASRTLCSKTDSLDRLRAALGERIKGVRMGMTPHTIYEECLEVAAEAKAIGADTVVTLGAGSLADAAKFVCCSMANDFRTIDDLAAHEKRWDGDRVVLPPLRPHGANLVMIPTSLSAGEHTRSAGVTDGATRRKYQLPSGGASVVILDPWLCLSTPASIWLQSGVRGIDHAVEGACGRYSRPECVDVCVRGLQLLIPGLLACVRDGDGDGDGTADLVKARLNAQLGVALAITPLLWECWAGASHGIGHMLGPFGVGHGETSCILLPAVCRYNKSANGDKQAFIADALWEVPECAQLFDDKALKKETAELPDLLDVVIRALGMPRTLKEKGVVGEEKLQALAENSLHDYFLSTNPIPIKTTDEVMKILKEVEG